MSAFTKKNLLFTIAGIFAVLIAPKAAAQTYAALPFTESFENAWVNKDGTRDVPSAYWKNTPATTDSSWSRDDDGVARGAWSWSSGSYSPPGANGSIHSARFHSYDATLGTSGKFDLYVNFSGYSDAKTLTFWYINTSGSDKLEVFLSTNGGSSFGSVLSTQNIQSSWTKVTVNLGTVVSSTCVIRFKATADNGASDIGIDNMAITTPTTPITADFSVNRTDGMAPVTVRFADLSTPDVTSWNWDFNNDGTNDATTQNPSYTYTTTGTYTVKLTTSKAGSSQTITKTNLITITPTQYASLPFSENFDSTTWINKDSIRDAPSIYFKSNPVSGDNSWSRDDDPYRAWAWAYFGYYTPAGALGTSHSARFHSSNTTLSGTLDAYINFSSQTGSKTLTFWYINPTGSDKLEVFLSTDGGTTFGSVLSTQVTASNWTKVSVILGSVTSATGVVRFKATGDYGSDDIGLDGIHIESPSASTVNANFFTNTRTGMASLAVNFTDQSTGAPTSWSWDFNNDGTPDATTQNPTYTYTTPGIYTVKLTASKTGSSDTETKTSYIFVGGYASLPYSENFENPWINRDNTRDVPSVYIKNNPATGDNSWSRDDDGYNRGVWEDDYGTYTPTGANSSTRSARFHSYITTSSGMLDFYINFSTLSGNKTLTFWCINTSGTDSLKVYLSTNGGTTFGSALTSQLINATWTQISIDLGNIVATNGIIRFRAVGDYGSTDIGLDDVSIGTTGVTPVDAKFKVNVKNGSAPLAVTFTDQSTGTPTSWTWNFGDGTQDNTQSPPNHTYTTPGIYTVSLKVSKTGSTDTETKTSYIFAGGYALLPFSENFENPWGNRDTTRDVPSAYVKNTPAIGNNSWSRDDDGVARLAWSFNSGSYSPAGANSSLHSARFHSYLTSSIGTLDFYINFSSLSGNKTLSYWYINPDGTDSIAVYLSTDGGTTFGAALNSQTVKTNWTQITLDLGNITAANGVLRFKAFGDFGDTDLGLDDISIVGSVPVVAQFTANTTTGLAPLAVTFTDQSAGNPTAWKWDFGDGTTDATQSPAHNYTTAGIYTVKLVASKTGSKDSITRVNYITVTGPTPVDAQFTADKTTGVAPLAVTFTDQSDGNPTAWKWYFGDGATDVTQSPTHTYTTAGTYTVKLVASKTGSKDSITKVDYITVKIVDAKFSATPVTGVYPLQVQFTDQSDGNPTAWKWDFNNDGIVDATTQNPTYNYTTAGTYTVKLVASKTGGKDSITKVNYITVTDPNPVSAQFAANKTTVVARLAVTFTDQSSGNPTAWKWNFGDGAEDNTQSPTHKYTTADTYTVKLVASKTGSKDSITKVNYITVVDSVVAKFTANPFTGDVPLKVQFTDQSTGNPTAWKWNFGDGTQDNTQSPPTHTYTTAGTYSVKLVVSKTDSKDSTTKTINVNVPPPHVGISIANSQEEAVNVFPNPTDGMVTISFINFGNEKTRIEVVDMNGKVVQLTNIENKPTCSLDISSLSSGIYYIRTICKDKVYINKVIKR
jgi:PKD repeat protein